MNMPTPTKEDNRLEKRLGWILTIGGAFFALYIISSLFSGADFESIREAVVENPARIFIGIISETWPPLVLAIFGFPIARRTTTFLKNGTPVSRLGWTLTVGGVAFSLYIFAGLAWFLLGAPGIDQDLPGLQEARQSIIENPGFLIKYAFSQTWLSLALAAFGFPIARFVMEIINKAQEQMRKAAANRATTQAHAGKSVAIQNDANRPTSKIGVAFVVLGAIGLITALSLDTTVSTGYGRVHNLGLLQSQQMYLFISGLFILIGGALSRADTKSESSSPASQQQQAIHAFAGERNIEADSYQIFLVKKYAIEKNQTLGKFIVRDRSFETLPLALEYADTLEGDRSNA